MDSQMRLGAVLIGGYLLGRTKKGGMALRLATQMMMKGTNANPRELVQENVLKALQSDIVDQLRAQAMEAAKAALDARLQGLAQNLTDRTEALKGATDTATDAAGDVTDTATKGVSDVTSKTTGALTVKSDEDEGEDEEQSEDESQDEDQETEEEQDDEQGEQEDQEAEGEAEDGEGEGEGEDAEAEPEDEAGDEDDESDDDAEAQIQERAKELKRKRITTLRKMAKEVFDEAEDDKIDKAEKETLARWIAEEEADTEEED